MMKYEDYLLEFRTIKGNHFSVENLIKIAQEKFEIKFDVDNDNRETVNLLLRYFLRHRESELDVNKGICLIGPIGSGKTLLMSLFQELCYMFYSRVFNLQLFENVFKNHPFIFEYEELEDNYFTLIKELDDQIGEQRQVIENEVKELEYKLVIFKVNQGLNKVFDYRSELFKEHFDFIDARHIIRIFDKNGYGKLNDWDKNYQESNIRLFGNNLCIDDIGLEPKFANNFGTPILVMPNILLDRYNTLREYKTHLITNLSIDQLEIEYGDRISSRLRQMVNVVYLNGNDRRK